MSSIVRAVTKEQSATGWGILIDGDQIAATTPCCGDVTVWKANIDKAVCCSCEKKYAATVTGPGAVPGYDTEFVRAGFHRVYSQEDDWTPWLSVITGLPLEAFTVTVTT